VKRQLIICDPDDEYVPNRVIRFLSLADVDKYGKRKNAVTAPNISAVSGVLMIYWKYEGGRVVEMNAAEKTRMAVYITKMVDQFNLLRAP